MKKENNSRLWSDILTPVPMSSLISWLVIRTKEG
jgi:hypothetical protein